MEDVLAIHDDIVSEYSDTQSGVQNRGDIEFVLNYIEDGSFGVAPETIHEKAFHLLRLLVANHSFVDANKRTALNATVVFYESNADGIGLFSGEEVESLVAFYTDLYWLRDQQDIEDKKERVHEIVDKRQRAITSLREVECVFQTHRAMDSCSEVTERRG